MRSRRGLAAAAALLGAVAAAGCGVGAGAGRGEVELRVTRDYGREVLVGPQQVEARESDTVFRLLDGEADLSTRYGGKFVQSVNGLEGTEEGGRRFDWFFYIDGVESPVGAADVTPEAGQRIWWDYRDWSSAMRVPAVVGAYPEPFAHGFEGAVHRTRIDCLGERAPCDAVRASLKEEGVQAGVFEAEHAPGYGAESGPTLRILVGPWARVGEDPAAAQIEQGPDHSGVFARFQGEGAAAGLLGLSERGEVSQRFGPDAGLIAATRFEDRPPTWVISGATPAGTAAAARAFTAEDLDSRYAVIAAPGGAGALTPVPIASGSP